MPQLLVPIFVSILPASIAGITIGGVTVASALATLTIGLISIAVMLLLAPKPKAPEDGHFAIQQATPPKIFAYGKTRIAGYIVLLEEYKGALFHVSALCAHKCNAVTGYFLNDDKVSVVSDIVQGGSDDRYSSNAIAIYYRLGEPTETTYSALSTLYTSHVWDATGTGDGVASLCMTCAARGSSEFYTVYPLSRPQPSVEMETAILYDPRTDVWEYSDNTALELLHFLCFCEFGPQRSYEKCILPVVDFWKAAADICDEFVDLKSGGTEKRYRSGGFDTTDHDTRSVLNELLASCDGWLCERGDGTVILTVGKYEEPTQTITDDDIIGWTIQSDVPDEYAVNEITTTFCFVDAGYSTASVDPWEDEADQAARGSKRSTSFELRWVQSFTQARRLAKREMSRQKERIRGQLILNLGAIGKIHSRWVRVKSNFVPFLNDHVVENRKAVVSIMGASIALDYVGSGPYIDDWSPTDDEGREPVAPTVTSSTLVPAPVGVSAVVEETGGVSYVDVSFNKPDYDAGVDGSSSYSPITYVIRWRYSSSDSGGGPGSWTEVEYKSPPAPVAGRITLTLSPVPQNTSIDIEICNVSPKGSRTAFSNPITVSTVVSAAAPGTPQNGSAVGGIGVAQVSWYNPNSETMYYAVVFRGYSGDPFSSTVSVSSHLYGSANQYMSYNDAVSPGTYDYWVVAYSRSDAASTAAGPFSATVT